MIQTLSEKINNQNHDHSHDHDHITSKKEISNRVTGENVYFRKVEEME